MAVLSTAEQSILQSAVDILVKGTAYETPLDQITVQRLADFVKAAGSDVSGIIFEMARDNPKSLLIAIVLDIGFPVLSANELARLESAIELMQIGTAYETPFAEDVIERLAPVAESSGFLTKGGFYEAIRDRPVSTMLRWALKLGS